MILNQKDIEEKVEDLAALLKTIKACGATALALVLIILAALLFMQLVIGVGQQKEFEIATLTLSEWGSFLSGFLNLIALVFVATGFFVTLVDIQIARWEFKSSSLEQEKTNQQLETGQEELMLFYKLQSIEQELKGIPRFSGSIRTSKTELLRNGVSKGVPLNNQRFFYIELVQVKGDPVVLQHAYVYTNSGEPVMQWIYGNTSPSERILDQKKVVVGTILDWPESGGDVGVDYEFRIQYTDWTGQDRTHIFDLTNIHQGGADAKQDELFKERKLIENRLKEIRSKNDC